MIKGLIRTRYVTKNKFENPFSFFYNDDAACHLIHTQFGILCFHANTKNHGIKKKKHKKDSHKLSSTQKKQQEASKSESTLSQNTLKQNKTADPANNTVSTGTADHTTNIQQIKHNNKNESN